MAMAELVELFRWQYISVVYEESSYGTKVNILKHEIWKYDNEIWKYGNEIGNMAMK